MVRFKQRLDSSGKIYIPKILREAGFAPEIEIAPNSHAAVMFPSGSNVDEVLNSLEIIKLDLAHNATSDRLRPGPRTEEAEAAGKL